MTGHSCECSLREMKREEMKHSKAGTRLRFGDLAHRSPSMYSVHVPGLVSWPVTPEVSKLRLGQKVRFPGGKAGSAASYLPNWGRTRCW